MIEVESQNPPPRVAIIGVHGIAHHEPGATANAMADLLLSLPTKNPQGPATYEPFSATSIRVPLRMPLIAPLPAPKQNKFWRWFDFFQEKSAIFARLGTQYGGKKKSSGERVPAGSASNAYMRLLLQGYRGGAHGNYYATTRLEGRRAGDERTSPAEVHIYEMLWADLARPTNTILSFLLSLFQLVLHLGSLSRLAIDSGSAENTGWTWNTYCSVQRYAVRMLQIPIPLIKIILLITLFSCVPSLKFGSEGGWWLAILMAGIVGLVITFLGNQRNQRVVTSPPWIWASRAILPAALGIGSAVGLHRLKIPADILLALECWILVGSTLVLYVLGQYESVRRGVKATGLGLYGIFALLFTYYLWAAKPLGAAVPQATFWTTIWILAALRFSWIVLFVLALLAFGLGSLAWRSIPKADFGRRARAMAAVRTSRFALALPAILFLLITTVLWAGMFSVARMVHDPFFDARYLSLTPRESWLPVYSLVPDPKITRQATNESCDPQSNPGCSKTKLVRVELLPEKQYREHSAEPGHIEQLARIRPVPDESKEFKPDYLRDVLEWSVTDGFVLVVALLGVVLFLLFWWVLPGVMTETYPLRGDAKPPRSSTNQQTERLGTWTSRGLNATPVVTLLLWLGIFVVPPLFLLAPVLSRIPFLGRWIPEMTNWSGQASHLLVHSFIAFGTAAGLAAVIHYGSPVLSAILDVDNYLRTSPEDATPRAKIAERYVSLLHHVAQYRGADGRGYDSVVIVSHSLGTLISADLFRFLHKDGCLEAMGFGEVGGSKPLIPITLLTMGSPIRQLLNRFFPFLYDWVRSIPDNSLESMAPSSTIPAVAPPDPADLGVAKWVNLYRSGDYVGRSLWLDEWYRRSGNTQSGLIHLALAPQRVEGCIGAGAHTHYWDDTASDVAEMLNSLV